MRTTAVYFTANPFNLSLQQPGDICTFLGLCGGRDIDRIRDLLLNHMSKTLPVPTMKVTFEEMILKLLFACSAQLTRFLCSLTQMEMSMQCSVCTYIVSTLEYLFPRERTQVKNHNTYRLSSEKQVCLVVSNVHFLKKSF